MKNQWLVWAFIAGVIVFVIIAFNSENRNKTVEDMPAEIQYEGDAPVAEEPEGVAPVEDVEAPVAVTEVAPEPVVQKAIEAPAVKAQQSVSANSVEPVAQVAQDFNFPYTIQIASTRGQKDAERLLANILKKGHAGYIAQRDLGSKGMWYRVYIGRFMSKVEAENHLKKIQKDFPSAFVILPPKKK